jgi:NDP-sugar pyrophosphorylase family protein
MINVIIPAAGKGSRFSNVGIVVPKPLISVKDKTLIEHSIDIVKDFSQNIFIITKNFLDEKYNKKISKIIKDNSAIELFVFGEENHSGAAASSFFAKDSFADHNLLESPLIVINSDQIINWDPAPFFDFIKKNDPDGAVILYKSSNPRNSFAKIENGKIVEIVEKDPISNDALIGFHYWKKAEDFFNSSEELSNKLWSTLHEPYISETYNFLINKNKTILPYYFEDGQYISLGTPEDIDKYLGDNEWRKQDGD